MLGLSLALLAVSLTIVFVGRRPRFVGDDPHCRACGFNLRGRAAGSTRCAECGAELTRANIDIGQRRRRPAVVALGLGLALLASAGISVTVWQWAQAKDWSPWKPTAWLISDMDSANARDRSRAVRELHERLKRKTFPQDEVDKIVDHALSLQADRSKPWNDDIGRLFESAAGAGRVDRARAERYLRQAVSAQLRVKPKARRGKDFAVSIRGEMDRCFDGGARGTYRVAPLTIGNLRAELTKTGSATDFARAFSTNAYVGGAAWRDAELPDGTHELRSSVQVEVSISGIDAKARVELPVSATVEVVPPETLVDTFAADPAQRADMAKAIEVALVDSQRVNNEASLVRLRLKYRNLPVPLAVEPYVIAGAAEHKLDPLLLEPQPSPRWTWAADFIAPDISGQTVTVALRPSQDAADRHQRTQLGTYWGEPIVLRDVKVNAPYAAPFNTLESLRPAVEKSLTPRVERTRGGGLKVTLRAKDPPVELAYKVVVAGPQRQHVLDSCWTANAGGDSSSSLACDDIDPQHQAQTCDLILTPSDSWELHAQHLLDPKPPWGGAITFRNVPIESTAASP